MKTSPEIDGKIMKLLCLAPTLTEHKSISVCSDLIMWMNPSRAGLVLFKLSADV